MNRSILLAALTSITVPGAALAGGLSVPGYGSAAQPRAGAFVAKADDPSALFHNPAGLARQRGTSLHIGVNLLHFDQKFQRAGVYDDIQLADEPYEGQPYAPVEDGSNPFGLGSTLPIPLIAVSTDLGLDLPVQFAAGFLLDNAYPFRDYEDDYLFEAPGVAPPPQRYDVITQEVLAAFPTVGAGYSITDTIHIGAAFAWGFGIIEAKKHVWGIRNYEEWVAQDGQVTFKASDKFVPALSAGVLWEATPSIELAAAYRTQINVGARGDLSSTLGSNVAPEGIPDEIEPVDDSLSKCETGGRIGAIKACLDVKIPQHAIIGARYIIRDGDRERADIEFDVQWEDWSNASDVRLVADGQAAATGRALEEVISRHGFKDTFSFRLGGSYNIPVGASTLSVRAGAAYDTAAADNEFTRLDLDGFARTTLGLGVGYQTGRWSIDLGVGASLEADRTVSADCNPEVATPGCEGTGSDTPVRDRTSPDPEQPLLGPFNQVQSPFNGGEYSQGYLLGSVGVTSRF
jgi:long-chain fatty acid transport protein